MAHYKFSSLSQNFDFGKFSGISLDEVLRKNPSYITWCINNIPDFCMTPDLIYKVKSNFSDFHIDDDFENRYFHQCIKNIPSVEYDDVSHSSYEEFSGSYAQDVMGYSDEDINDAFDGDPDCYWNID